MGWLFCEEHTKDSLRQELTREQPRNNGYFKTLQSQFRGNTLWCLHESYDGEKTVRFIGCYLFARNDGMWGYKDMDESMGPCYYNCPVSYIDKATEPINSYAEEWRKKVRLHAEAAAAQNAKKPKIGELWSLIGCKIPYVVICSEKPLHGNSGGRTWKICRRHLGKKIEEVSRGTETPMEAANQ